MENFLLSIFGEIWPKSLYIVRLYYSTCIHVYSFGVDTNRTLLDDVSCSNSGYLMLFQCAVSTSINSLCTDADDISVTCCKCLYYCMRCTVHVH